MIERVTAALRHAGGLEEAIRDELKGFLAPEDDSREALARALESTAARHKTTVAGSSGLADGLDTSPRSCFEYQGRVDDLAATLGWRIVDEALIRASAAFGLLLDETGTSCAFIGPVAGEEAARILG